MENLEGITLDLELGTLILDTNNGLVLDFKVCDNELEVNLTDNDNDSQPETIILNHNDVTTLIKFLTELVDTNRL